MNIVLFFDSKSLYLKGAVRSLRASKMTTMNASAITTNPGMPTSSTKPV